MFFQNNCVGCLKKINTNIDDKPEIISGQQGNRTEEIESNISSDVRHDNADVIEAGEISERTEPRRSL